jgi:DNA-binding IclR family transcriptional regulator
VAAVAHAIQVLDALAAAPRGLELNAIAAAVGMSPAGAYRTLYTLAAGGLVTQVGRRGLYRLGPKVLTLAQAMRGESALLAAAEPAMRELAAATGESVALAVLRNRRIWSIASFAGSGEIVAQPRLAHGEAYFHTTGRGKLYLAFLPPEEARAIIAATGLPPIGPNTVTDEATLWRQVDEARERGYAINRRERSEHLAGVAVPILDPQGHILATLGITVPAYRLDAAREAELARAGQAAARQIERGLRGEGGPSTRQD